MKGIRIPNVIPRASADDVRLYDRVFFASMNMISRKNKLMMKATMTPRKRAGMEKEKLLRVIRSMRCRFMKPRARNIPYSYVFPSTSASISENTRKLARIDRKTIAVRKVEFRKSCTSAVNLNCFIRGVVMVVFARRVIASTSSSARGSIPFLMSS